MDDSIAPKRRRVTRACENCRALKSKCDGKSPVCGRCHGYGYTCRWRNRSTRNEEFTRLSKPPAETYEALRNKLQTSQALLRRLRHKLGPDDQVKVDSILQNQATLSEPLSPPSSSTLRNGLEYLSTHSDRRATSLTNRYLGDASDVSFFNVARKLLQGDPTGSYNDEPLESYEGEAAETLEAADVSLPDRKSTDELIDIYFSTIHVAYPYICRMQFVQDYEQYWSSELSTEKRSYFVPLLLTIFAIGSYYNVCALPTEEVGTAVHSDYFRCAVVAASPLETQRSIEHVRLLLAQCFYLLATCQTDRCWMTLGFAIRIGQSIGLHVEEGRSQTRTRKTAIVQELRRRTWHSLYVLDQLLSLQLGRPSATRDSDCNVRLPSRLDDTEFDLVNNIVPDDDDTKPKSGDYFINVIKFSVVIGHVMQDLYRPKCVDYSEDMLACTERLDAELLKWRDHLPRSLRFDRGHTFEHSPVLKRQRNMLAIKFHHLRALVHRPALCLPWLQRNNSNIKALLEAQSHRVVYSESICVAEAQETAHRLHDVTDKKSLVEDFPWWQMISCLMCASSILLVRRAFASTTTAKERSDREMLEEDADLLLLVFEALSKNSAAARSARDMLYNLRNSQVPLDESSIHGDSQTDGEVVSKHLAVPTSTEAPASESYQEIMFDLQPGDELNNAAAAWIWQDWPSEIADSMTWSSQFIDALDPSLLSLSGNSIAS